MTLSAGTRFGAYQIGSLLGSGGMGEVYTATDTRLGRSVAIKILPALLATDPAAVARFEQEARAVAALSHPNILAIHDVGRQDEIAFAVMELLDGETLRERLQRGRIPLRRVVDYALQLAQGLAAAHAKGILHRDIKPENVFLTTDGHLKILDFGLAKVAAGAGAAGTEDTRMREPTEAGTVLGTTGYLSPEQAQAKPVDHRSDIFSFGAVLYEMATGARAFKGDSTIDTLHRIVHGDPPAIETVYPDAPSELKWLLAKCLAKDPDDRYQSTRDLVVDLKSLSRSLDSSPKLAVTAAPALPPVTRSASRLPWPILAIGAVIVAGLIAVAMFWQRGRGVTDSAGAASAKLSVERITASGDVIDAVISPDGKLVAYVVSTNGQQSLWIRQLATASALQLVPPAIGGYWGAMFTPDGSAVDYVIVSNAVPDRALFRVPALGGTPRRLLDRLASFPVFSPDGTQMAFMREGSPDPSSSAVWIADADGGHLRMLAARKAPEFFVPLFFTAPAWSPDGTLIVCPMERRADKTVGTLVAYRVSDGAEVPFPHYEWPGVGQATWTPDGRGLVAVGMDDGARHQQLWWVSAHDVSRRRITNDLLDYRTVSFTADGASLVTVASDATSSIWAAPLDGAGDASRLSTGRYDGIEGMAAVADGRILYRSLESGTASIWIMDAAGNNKRQVTTDGETSAPAPTADARSMVFVKDGAGLWTADLDGQNAREIPGTKSAQNPVVTPDGKWVFFVLSPNGTPEIWKAPVDGGSAPVRAIDGYAFEPAISPDGRQLAFYYLAGSSPSYVLAVVPLTTSGVPHPTSSFPVAPSSSWSMVRWTPDGRALLHNSAPKDRANIWLQPIAGGPPRQITHFVDQTIMAFDPSADGKRLIIARGVLSRDAMLLKNFR